MTRFTLAALATAALAALGSPAFASNLIHPNTTEMGYTVHPDHAAQGKSRAEVVAELQAARKDASWQALRVGAPLPPKMDQPRTRAEVEAELLRAQQHPSWSARRVGAPVTME